MGYDPKSSLIYQEESAVDMGVKEYLERQREWSTRTFGYGKRTMGISEHIRKELLEIAADPHDSKEWIDVIILAMDGYWRSGGELELLMAGLRYKQQLNFSRKWPVPESEDVAVEHID